MRSLLRILLGVGALCALAIMAVVVFVWVLASQQGTAWLLDRLQARSAGALDIGRVSGSLLDGLVLDDVRVRLARDELDISTMSLSWNALAAWSQVLELDDVRIGTVDYRRLPPTGSTAARAALDLPIEIRVRDAVAQSVTLAVGGETLLFGETTAAARFADGVLVLERAATTTSGVTLTGRGQARLDETIHVDVQVDWSQPRADQTFSGTLTASGDLPVLQVHHELTAPFAIVADGELTVGSPLRADLVVEWQDLNVPGASGIVSRAGRLMLTGGIEEYSFDGSGEILIGGQDATFVLRGTGRSAQLALESLALDSARGALTAAGEVALDTRELDLTVGARDFDPSWFLPDWPGRLSGSAMVRGVLAPLAADVDALEVTGSLRGYPVTATGAIALTPTRRWQLESVRIDSGASSIVLDGELGAELDEELTLAVVANIADLSLLRPGLTGSLVADLTLAGSLREPRGTGTIEARTLVLGEYSVDRLSVAGPFGLGAQDEIDLAIEADEVARGSIAARTVRIAIVGAAQAHAITFAAGTARWHSMATLAGGLAAGRWRGSIETLEVDEMQLGAWRLTAPAVAALGRDTLVLETSCMTHESGGIWCAELRFEGNAQDRLVVSAQNFDLATLQPLLPQQLSVQGVYQLSASFVDLRGEPRGSLAISGGVTPVSVGFSDRQAFATQLEDLIVGATLADGRLELQASVMSRDSGGRVNFQTQIDDIRAADSPISGDLNVYWPDLTFLSLVSPDVSDIGGAIEADWQIAGTVDEPQLQGRAQWNDGELSVPAWGLVIDRIQADASSSDDELEFRATGWVGDGELRLDGTTDLDRAAGWPTRLTLRGESIRAVQLPNVEIFVSPDLTVFAELPDVQVTGTVHIPRARIEISQLPEQAIAVSPDAIVHGVEAANEFRSLRLQSDIQITLGEEVEYLGLNLTTKVSGELRVRRDANLTTTATGSLVLAGNYSAYGQTLQLERGQLLFNGPLDDPALDVRAVRVVDTTRVGVELVGTVKAPRTRVFSDPAMSEADALSYLLVGRPVNGTGAEETATLQAAAIAMGLRQALPVVTRIGQSLGLDEFTVETTDTDAGALMAGKYLSPKVYIRYSYGLFNRMGGLLLRFRVNERLSIETRSGDQKSMDLLYTVEKD